MKLSMEGRQPGSLQAVALNLEKAGHSFTRDPEAPRRVLAKAAERAGVKPGEPGRLLYVPSPFETTIYPHVLEASLRLLRDSGYEVTVSPRVLDFGGNAAFDAARPDIGLRAVERAVEEAERLGAEVIVLSGCGADHKLAALAEPDGVQVASLYSLAAGRRGADCRSCILFPSCVFARFERRELPRVQAVAGDAEQPRDRAPFTLCCGGGGGVNYLHEKPFNRLRERIYAWRVRRLATELGGAKGTILTPCIKCYTVLRHGAIRAGLQARVRIEHLALAAARTAGRGHRPGMDT